MKQANTHQNIESQLSQLDELEQQTVLSFIQSLLSQKYTQPQKNLRNLMKLANIGNSNVTDGAAEHDHYVYGTPKKNQQ